MLPCPDLRHLRQLAPRPNPLLRRVGDLGRVFDGDRVALNVVGYAAAGAAAAARAAGGFGAVHSWGWLAAGRVGMGSSK